MAGAVSAALLPQRDEAAQRVLTLSKTAIITFEFATQQFEIGDEGARLLAWQRGTRVPLAELRAMIDPGDEMHFPPHIDVFLAGTAKSFDKDLRLNCPDGVARWLRIQLWTEDGPATATPTHAVGWIRDITDEQARQREMSQSERWFMEVLDESPHALYRVDLRKNRFDYVSRGFAKTLGMTREDVLNTSYGDFALRFHPDDIARVTSDLNGLVAANPGQKITAYAEVRLRRRDGTYVWVNDTFTMVPDETGNFVYQVGFGHDITQRKQLEDDLRTARDELEQRVAERTRELAETNQRLRHEVAERLRLETELLRAAERERNRLGRELHDDISQRLNGIAMMQEALTEQAVSSAAPLADRSRQIVEYMATAREALRRLSHDECALQIDPYSLARQLHGLAQETAQRHGVRCECACDDEARPPTQDAAIHLYRIAQEAVSNAVRHGRPKSITLCLQRQHDTVTLSIANDGADFADPTAPRSGLGLHSMDARCRLLGGQLTVSRGPTGGTLVVARIPA